MTSRFARLVVHAAQVRLVLRAAAVTCLCFLGSGCDQGSPSDQSTRGPLLHVASSNIGPKVTLPSDGVVQIAFDRPLLPSTVNRQSIVLREASGAPVSPPVVAYDPVAKVVSIANPNPGGGAWLSEGLSYKVQLLRPSSERDTGGLRAIDRAPIAPDERTPLVFEVGPPKGATARTAVSFCADILPLLQTRCAGGTCHGANAAVSLAAAGLVLTTEVGVRSTALNRVARGANTGSRQAASAPGAVFGLDMPLIDPGVPGDSWLLYKVLLADHDGADDGVATRADCDGGVAPDVTPAVGAPWTASDRATLGTFVTGQAMPYPTFTTTGEATKASALSLADIHRLRAWIAQGADVPDCTACGLSTSPAPSPSSP